MYRPIASLLFHTGFSKLVGKRVLSLEKVGNAPPPSASRPHCTADSSRLYM